MAKQQQPKPAPFSAEKVIKTMVRKEVNKMANQLVNQLSLLNNKTQQTFVETEAKLRALHAMLMGKHCLELHLVEEGIITKEGLDARVASWNEEQKKRQEEEAKAQEEIQKKVQPSPPPKINMQASGRNEPPQPGVNDG